MLNVEFCIDQLGQTEEDGRVAVVATAVTYGQGVNAELADLFSKKSVEALKNFAASFNNEGVSSMVGLRVRPSLSVGTTQVPFPNYINLEKKTGTSTSSSTNTSRKG